MTRQTPVQTQPRPRQHVTQTARIQHGRLTAATILRLRRYATQIAADLEAGLISVEHADQISIAALTLVRETASLDARTAHCGDAEGIARGAAELILECADAVEAGEDAAAEALVALAAAGRLLAAFVALAVRVEEEAA
jgi:hypothetical protein